jgi:PIN domain nuclease of toxin-antitoxin system
VSRIVLDASALLAVLYGEADAEKLTPQLLSHAVTSTVNLAEVQAKLVQRGLNPGDAWEAALSPVREGVDFSAEQARITGSLVAQTKAIGLSLGDRACLALGILLKSPIYTADKSWKSLKLGVPIHVIR